MLVVEKRQYLYHHELKLKRIHFIIFNVLINTNHTYLTKLSYAHPIFNKYLINPCYIPGTITRVVCEKEWI